LSVDGLKLLELRAGQVVATRTKCNDSKAWPACCITTRCGGRER